jgi:hypothetical protein
MPQAEGMSCVTAYWSVPIPFVPPGQYSRDRNPGWLVMLGRCRRHVGLASELGALALCETSPARLLPPGPTASLPTLLRASCRWRICRATASGPKQSEASSQSPSATVVRSASTMRDHPRPALLRTGLRKYSRCILTSTYASTTRLIISDIGFWHASAHAASTACETLSR